MRVLLINSYAGSLALAAKAAGAEVVGSYEDAGFGLGVQRANFPDTTYAAYRQDWPNISRGSLRGAVVLAHPPCSAFSLQNSQQASKGVDSDAFACTRQVLDYALAGACDALAVESVTAAAAGAAEIHEAAARRYGYELHRVLQNSILFGVPQWRERFWAVFVRRDIGPGRDGMAWSLGPRVVSLGDVLRGGAPGEIPSECEKDLAKLVTKLEARAGLNPKRVRALLGASSDFSGSVSEYLASSGEWPHLNDPRDVHERCIGGFTSRALKFLAPGDYAPVLLSDSWWWYAGRQISLDDYSRIMGFPADYAWPGRTSQQRRLYLSKGVVPAVARWVLENIWRNLPAEVPIRRDSLTRFSAIQRVATGGRVVEPATVSRVTRDGEVALFRGSRPLWQWFLESGEPPLRRE